MNDELIKNRVVAELIKAEQIWKQVEPEFMLEKAERSSNFSGASVPTKIPGFTFLIDGKPQVADFIAFVLDIRNSTNHLLQAISEKTAKASQLERVLYETTAVYTAGAMIIEEKSGAITEFLGDGFLALFKIEKGSQQAIYNAHNAAVECLSVNRKIVNAVLKERYSLPPLEIGIGLASSKAIVTVVGTEDNLHPKAIGECVYRASKISDGHNEIYIDEALKLRWPTSDDGTLKFHLFSRPGFNSYKIL